MGRNMRVCKFEMAFKAMQQKTKAVAESANNNKGNQMWRIAGGVSQPQSSQPQSINLDEKRRRRREEKDENLFHLICFGPS